MPGGGVEGLKVRRDLGRFGGTNVCQRREKLALPDWRKKGGAPALATRD